MRGMNGLKEFFNTLMSIIPLTGILVLLQVLVFKKPFQDVKQFTIGFIFAALGLHFFLLGAELSLIPLAENVGQSFISLNRKWIIIIIGFVVGFLATLVEPGLQALANEVELQSAGAIPSKVLLYGVACGFGLGLSLGLLKIVLDINYLKIVVPMLVTIVVLSFLAPEPFNAIAFDAASATTGPVNIPINMALAMGLASVIEGVDPLLSGFGIVGLTSIGTMISVLILGILTRF